MQHRTGIAICAVAVVVVLAGYSALRLTTNIQLIDTDFAGLRGNVDARGGRMLHVIMIHGIGRHCIGYSRSFERNLAARLGLEPLNGTTAEQIEASSKACRDPKVFGNEYDFWNSQFLSCDGLNRREHESCQRLTIDVEYFNPEENTNDKQQFDTGYVRTAEYAPPDETVPRMRFYEVIWDASTRVSKIRYVQTVDYQFERYRVPVNHKLKRDLINDTITDAVLYLGRYQRVMQYPLLASFCKVVESGLTVEQSTGSIFRCDFGKLDGAEFERFGDRNDIAIITHSLGTRMLFDTLGLMTDPQVLKTMNESLTPIGAVFDYKPSDEIVARGLRSAFSTSIRQIFTLANQVPIFQLSRVRNPVIPIDDADLGERFGKFLDERAKSTDSTLNVVAFTDPNDLLSYNLKCTYYMNVLKQDPHIKEWRMEDEGAVKNWFKKCYQPGDEVVWNRSQRRVTITDVTLNLAEAIPFFAANPSGAHSNYFSDDRVLDMIACGGDAKTDSPKVCTNDTVVSLNPDQNHLAVRH